MLRGISLAAAGVLSASALVVTASPATAAWTTGTFTAVSTNVVFRSGITPVVTCANSLWRGTILTTGALQVSTATFAACSFKVTAAGLNWPGNITGTSFGLQNFRVVISAPAASCTLTGSPAGTALGNGPTSTVTIANQPLTPPFCFPNPNVSATYNFTQP